MNKFIVKIDGGIGNQMFEYAWARAMQKLYGGEIWLDGHAYRQKGAYRKLSLLHFDLNGDVHVIDSFADKTRMYYCAARKRITDVLYTKSNQNNYLNKIGWGVYGQYTHNSFDCFVKPQRQLNYVTGSWFSEDFFEPAKDEIKKEFIVKTPANETSNKLLDEIASCESVCVHIRLGDLLNEPYYSRAFLCGNSYYYHAIEMMLEKLKAPVFYIFTNRHKDFMYLQENYKFPVDVKFVDLGNPDYEDLRLMYSCKHQIIGNSTYSWWAQYLNPNPEKIIVAPCMINKHNLWSLKNMFMDSWELVGPEYLELGGMTSTKEINTVAPSIAWEEVEEAYIKQMKVGRKF